MKIIEFEQIYHKSFNVLCNKAYRMTNDVNAAKDIVQNVFLRFWNMKDTLIINTKPEAYLYRAVVNETLNYLDKKKRLTIIQDDKEAVNIASGQTTEEEIHFSELQQKVNTLLAQLPPKCRRVFLLSRFENMTYKEIAGFLNISENTVDNHIKKALALFRNELLIIMSIIIERF
ncbi:MAG: RNA polymerase sigma-70 factor [Bacteroidales bacterium]|nr:RNA polymerase sigma-70 factor [Bacteroidales bacterium]MBN2818858.1 RNA polymerase sigma-70 factor [Bacteroidales bacterium]